MQDVELVVESGPERVEVKIELFARLDAAAPASAILASSSSAIVTSRFTEKLAGRHRCLVAHPVNPPHVVPIVELSGAPWTSPETIARARAIYDSVGQVPIVVKREIDGFILNRMQAVLLSEAMRLVGEGYVTPRTSTRPSATDWASGGRSWARSRPSSSMRPAASPTTAPASATVFAELASKPVTPELWGKDNVGRAVASWGRSPSPQDILDKQRWRDDRLAALVAHKRSQAAPAE